MKEKVTSLSCVLLMTGLAGWVNCQAPPEAHQGDFQVLASSQNREADGASEAARRPEPSEDEALKALAREDPVAFLQRCLEQGPPKLDAYRCRFIVDERLDGKLTGEQVIDVLYQREPRRVYMQWRHNPPGAKRVLWIRGSNLSKEGEERVRIEPEGWARLFVSDISLPLSDKRVRGAGRRPITEFGPDATLTRIIEENKKAAQRGELKLKYDREGQIDGRPTFVFVRELPYDSGETRYSDARMVLHIDQEWLIPVGIYSYADHQQRVLLESYEKHGVRKMPELTSRHFTF